MLVSAIRQHESVIGIHISPPSGTSLPLPTPSHPSGLLQSAGLSCAGSLLLCAGFLWLQQVEAALSFYACTSHCRSFTCCGAQILGHVGLVVVAHRLSCSTVCGIFPDQGLNLCVLHWQVDSLLLSHQGSPHYTDF